MTALIWSEKSRSDIRRIDDWLTENAGGDVSIAMLSAVRARAAGLLDFPRIGQRVRSDMRVVRVTGTPYLLFYRWTNTTVEIARVRHNREDWQAGP